MIVSTLMYASPVVMEVGNYSAKRAFFEIHNLPHPVISLFPANWSHFTPVIFNAF